jgi:uncharacterized membrane protein
MVLLLLLLMVLPLAITLSNLKQPMHRAFNHPQLTILDILLNMLLPNMLPASYRHQHQHQLTISNLSISNLSISNLLQ